ncbi:DUF192 domain-containing protein [Labrys wisconsinensis]|uniref:Uncharacterized membrane protein (UPF0127 family) n=1 Tax=Labrys wisconsinensis TaxID=425677 RepID=A0ABU0J342_9HYPH|nr:DUF192 domain-containing protein [Labrys wisconsinensis]MDQ0468683.1 uncharacterized membrane protein (UPF0127 family) [Labrys wisconsinensis]
MFFLSLGALDRAQAEDGVFEPLTIVTKTGRHDFQVEVMRTDEEHARGMMFRRSLASDRGMLFQFKTEQETSFWMQNTYVPLDMIFIKADGRVHRVEANAEPLSTQSIPSGAPVLAVLEVLAGTAKRLDIEPGDKVEQAMFGPP